MAGRQIAIFRPGLPDYPPDAAAIKTEDRDLQRSWHRALGRQPYYGLAAAGNRQDDGLDRHTVGSWQSVARRDRGALVGREPRLSAGCQLAIEGSAAARATFPPMRRQRAARRSAQFRSGSRSPAGDATNVLTGLGACQEGVGTSTKRRSCHHLSCEISFEYFFYSFHRGRAAHFRPEGCSRAGHSRSPED
jgi:hypothetical protein